MLWIMSLSSSGPIWTISSERIWPKHSSRSMVSMIETALIVYALGRTRMSSPSPSYCLWRRLNIIRTSSGFWINDSWAQWIMVWEISSCNVPGKQSTMSYNHTKGCYVQFKLGREKIVMTRGWTLNNLTAKQLNKNLLRTIFTNKIREQKNKTKQYAAVH